MMLFVIGFLMASVSWLVVEIQDMIDWADFFGVEGRK